VTKGRLVHLDAAGSALPAPATVDAQVAHLRREAVVGGYVAQVEAEPALARARERLAAVLDVGAHEVALVESATRGFTTLLAAWPLPPRARVGVVPSEYASNRMALQAGLAAGRWSLVELPVGEHGRIDLEGLELALGRGLDLVTFPHVPSHRGVVQPAAEVARRCRAAGVPLLLDVAQSAGQLDVRGLGADAYVGTSRKWLRGPRGVGFVAVRAPLLERLRPPWPELANAAWCPDGGPPSFLPGAARLAGGEVPVAAQVGLAAALDAAAAEAEAVLAATAELGATARRRLDGLAGWRVQEPNDEPGGMVTLAHDRLDPARVQPALLHRGVVTALIPTSRAPLDLSRPVLRASFHGGYAEVDDVERLAAELAGNDGPGL
jgi:pyridoxal 5-phosphate dependent beta-lyase